MLKPDPNQFTPEQLALLKRMTAPVTFDPASVERKFLDVSYGTLPEQKLDVYLPPVGEGPFPLIIYVHGGGWTLGTRRECALECIIGVLNRGYALLSVDYRLAPATKFPEFLFDVKTAVRWARANAAQYGFDPERFAVMGDSAGAHLALMAGFTAGHPEYEGEKYGWAGVSSAVQAVVDLYGPVLLDADNFALLDESGVPKLSLTGNYDRAPLDKMMAYLTSDPDLLAIISPTAYVHKDIPPVLILQGEADPIVPKQHSTALYVRICSVCGPDRAEIRLYPERVHADYAFMTDETCGTVVEFLDRYFK